MTAAAAERRFTDQVEVSVVIPTSHREEFLREAIASALGQAGVALEVIVVDDSAEGSARANVEAFGSPRLRYLRDATPSQGHSGAVRNAGARVAAGRVLHFLDDDDRLEPGALALLSGALDRHRDAAFAFGRILPFGGTAEELEHERGYWDVAARAARRTHSRTGLAAHMLFRNAFLACSACTIRRRAFDALGGFDEALDALVDGDLFLRAGRGGGFAFVDAPVVQRRIGHVAVTRSDSAGERYRRAYQRVHAKYRGEHGPLEFYGLKALVRAGDRLTGLLTGA